MRLRLLLRKLLAMVLVVSLLPGLVEVVENLGHLLQDGHLAHSAQHELAQVVEDHDQGSDEEHGCTPMSHQCGCHVSVVGMLGDADPDLRRPRATPEARPFAPERLLRSRANAPPTRPPIA